MSFPFDASALGPLMAGFQDKVRQLREDAGRIEVDGAAGGGLVRVRANGKMQLVSVYISPEAREDGELLEDLVVAAVNDAMRKAREALASQVSELTGGLPIPPGLLNF